MDLDLEQSLHEKNASCATDVGLSFSLYATIPSTTCLLLWSFPSLFGAINEMKENPECIQTIFVIALQISSKYFII